MVMTEGDTKRENEQEFPNDIIMEKKRTMTKTLIMINLF